MSTALDSHIEFVLMLQLSVLCVCVLYRSRSQSCRRSLSRAPTPRIVSSRSRRISLAANPSSFSLRIRGDSN